MGEPKTAIYGGGGAMHRHLWRPRRDSNPQPTDSKNWAWASMASMETCTVYGLYEMNLSCSTQSMGSVECQAFCTGTAPEVHRRSSPWMTRKRCKERRLNLLRPLPDNLNRAQQLLLSTLV